MKTTPNIPILKPRREVLRASLRFGGLFVLGGIASALGWRSARNPCVRPNPCCACPLFTACDLPKAIDSKKSTANPTSNHG
jgi:hypothetical protein